MTKRVTLLVSIDVDKSVTTAELSCQLHDALVNKPQQLVQFKKGTLPDPDTMRKGTIYWDTVYVRQRSRK
jgi:hypothetical protein